MAQRRAPRKAKEVVLPNIDENAAERKRVLNVLAQRRYRQRRRERIATLEAQVKNKHASDDSASPTSQITSSSTSLTAAISETSVQSPNQAEKSFLPDMIDEIVAQAHLLPAECSNEVQTPDCELFPNALPTLDLSLYGADLGPDLVSASQTFNDWPLFRSSNASSPASGSAISSLRPSPSTRESFHSLLNSTLSPLLRYEGTEHHVFNPEDPTFTLKHPDTPHDFTSHLQNLQSTTFTFPDDHILHVPELTLLRATLTIATRLNVTDLIWSLTSTSPFYRGERELQDSSPSFSFSARDPSTPNSNEKSSSPILDITNLPANLRPIPAQLSLPHHPHLDIFPWPTVRNKLITVFNQPVHLRPPAARDPLALVNLVYDMEDSAGGLRVHTIYEMPLGGGKRKALDPCDGRAWEIGQKVFEKWWWAFDQGVVRQSNIWRAERGEGELKISELC